MGEDEVYIGEPGKITLRCPTESCGEEIKLDVNIEYTTHVMSNGVMLIDIHEPNVNVGPLMDHSVLVHGAVHILNDEVDGE